MAAVTASFYITPMYSSGVLSLHDIVKMLEDTWIILTICLLSILHFKDHYFIIMQDNYSTSQCKLELVWLPFHI